ncbi:MAG TPA: hypothetical protein V6D33_12495 [Cyanophyceae cyanobacterium]
MWQNFDQVMIDNCLEETYERRRPQEEQELAKAEAYHEEFAANNRDMIDDFFLKQRERRGFASNGNKT